MPEQVHQHLCSMNTGTTSIFIRWFSIHMSPEVCFLNSYLDSSFPLSFPPPITLILLTENTRYYSSSLQSTVFRAASLRLNHAQHLIWGANICWTCFDWGLTNSTCFNTSLGPSIRVFFTFVFWNIQSQYSTHCCKPSGEIDRPNIHIWKTSRYKIWPNSFYNIVPILLSCS